MREGWEVVRLGEVCEIDKDKYSASDLPFVGLEDIQSNAGPFIGNLTPRGMESSTFHFSENHLLYGRLRPYLNKVLLPNFEGHCSSEIFPLLTADGLDRRYLYYWLTSEPLVEKINLTCTGARMPRANVKEVLKFPIPLPPLAEQKRIVAVLDQAFAGIEQALAAARKNLSSARELFETTLNTTFTQKDELVSLSQLADEITDGDHSAPPKSESGVPFVTISNINKATHELDFSKTFKVPEAYFEALKPNKKPLVGDVLYTVTGSFGIPVIVQEQKEFCFQRHIGLIRPNKTTNSKWLFYLLKSPLVFNQANDRATGTAQKTVSLRVLRSIQVPRIGRDDQEIAVKKLDTLSTQTQRLEALYQQKIDALNELKQSLLQKAFAGELTAGNVLAFPKTLKADEPVDTTSPAFAANVIAFGYAHHVVKNRDKTYGRVKAQKLLHLVESMGIVELERQPMKDAAGPNDSAHMRRAENWAKEQQFFEFVKRLEGKRGYDFIKLPRYKEMKTKVFTMIKPYRDRLGKVVDLLVPMNTEQAEVFATVHAAWNNVILDGVEATDEAILYEARENWHSDKLKIPVSKFKNAIRQIRNNDVVPAGTAKRVGGQGGLF